MTYVWDNSRQTGTALLMLLALADHANDAGQCWPMIDRIAAKCRVNRRQAQYILSALEDAGEIVIERGQGRGHPSLYTVKGAPDCTFAEKDAPDCTFHDERVHQTAPFRKRKGALQRQEKVHSSASSLNKEEPSLEPSKTKALKPPPPSSSSEEEPPDQSPGQAAAEVATITTPEAFVALYNANIPAGIPMVKTLSPERRQRIGRYLKDFPDRLFWITCFRAPSTSPFLRGERNRDGHRHFVFDLDFLLRKGKDGVENCVKVYEGKYAEPPPSDEGPPPDRNPLEDFSPKMQHLVRQAQDSATRMKNDPRWNPALRKDPHAQP